ncbi:MAG: hypothetical protein ABI823_03610 [Bryobacteraceae bacterium]
MSKGIESWWLAIPCLLACSACFAQEEGPPPPPVEATAALSVQPAVPAVDPIAVHPLFGAVVPAGTYVPLTNEKRWQLFMRQTFTTPNPWLRTGISAAISQAQGRQYSWGGGVEGYSKRYASQYATYVIRNSFLSIGAWGLGHDTRYVPTTATNPAARIGHAVLQNVLTVNREGKTRIHISRILSGYLAGMIATNWQPHSKWSAQGLRAGNEQLMYGAIFNIGREFGTEADRLMKRIFHRGNTNIP